MKLDIPHDFHLLHNVNFNKLSRALPQIKNTNFILDENETENCIRCYNLSWILCRTAGDDTSQELVVVPQWSGFSKLLHQDAAQVTTYAYLSLLPYVASEYDTVWTTMVKCNDIAKKTKYGLHCHNV